MMIVVMMMVADDGDVGIVVWMIMMKMRRMLIYAQYCGLFQEQTILGLSLASKPWLMYV